MGTWSYFLYCSTLVVVCSLQPTNSYCYRTIENSKPNASLVVGPGSNCSALILSSHEGPEYQRNLTSRLNINSSKNDLLFVITFKLLDLPRRREGTCKSYIQIYGLNSFLSRFCGANEYTKEEKEGSVVSASPSIIIEWYASPFDASGKGFEMTVTPFEKTASSGRCSEDLFLCDNKRCINKNFVHDGRNNCGDMSDENFLTGLQIFGIVIGALCGVALLGGVIAFCFRRRSRKY